MAGRTRHPAREQGRDSTASAVAECKMEHWLSGPGSEPGNELRIMLGLCDRSRRIDRVQQKLKECARMRAEQRHGGGAEQRWRWDTCCVAFKERGIAAGAQLERGDNMLPEQRRRAHPLTSSRLTGSASQHRLSRLFHSHRLWPPGSGSLTRHLSRRWHGAGERPGRGRRPRRHGQPSPFRPTQGRA